MRFITIAFAVFLTAALTTTNAEAHGFSANRVKMIKTATGRLRIIVEYTHVSLGEYREAHVDFFDDSEAKKFHDDLVGGAEFFLGDLRKTIHFHNPPLKQRPY